MAHAIDLKVQIEVSADGSAATGGTRYQWVCSCGRVGPWHETDATGRGASAAVRAARSGGARHVAAMERGR